MKHRILFLLFSTFVTFTAVAQVQNAAVPKDAQVEVLVINKKKSTVFPNEVIIFKGEKSPHEYQGITDSSGRFTTRLPAGDKYEIFILGFKDSTSYMLLDIPALKGNAYYTSPFKVEIDFTPAKNFILEDVNFDFGKATLQPGSEVSLDELVRFMERKEDVRIEIGGHTDNVGKAASNLKLSQDRANTVMQYLIGKGIAPERLTARGYGMSVPIESNATEDGRAANRRTEAKIIE